MSRNPELTLIPEMSQGLDDVLKTRLVSQTGSATLIKCQDINERKCPTNESEYDVMYDATDAVSSNQNKIQGYAPPVAKTAAPEPVCCKVPKEVCEQVPRTVYDTISRRDCHDVADTFCADLQERKCQTSQKPVQEIVSRQKFSLGSGLFLMFLINLLRCQGDLAEISLNPERSQAISATNPSKRPVVKERKCVIGRGKCDVTYNESTPVSPCVARCPRRSAIRCPTTNDTVLRRQYQDVANTVCANSNKRKCQISQRRVENTVLHDVERLSSSKSRLDQVKIV